jgi:alanine racemase
MISFSQLPEITGGRHIQFYRDTAVEHIIIDSRKASSQPGAVFFAIKGIRHDGHIYIPDLYRLGTRQFVVEESVSNLSDFPEANFLLVSSTIAALQDVAAIHRKSFSIPVIGITGSNGKTIVKEWLFQMLSKDRAVVKNPGSFNSQVGVPLSVWQMQPHHQLGIFEAGISTKGEMERLEKIIQPSIGVFTNIGSAHDEGFSGEDQKIEEKLKLFRNSEVVIYRADQTAVKKVIEKSGLKTFSWGKKEDADVVVAVAGDRCNVLCGGKSEAFRMPFTDAASLENCMHCIAVMLYLRFGAKRIQQAINTLRSVPMRMEMKESINQSYLIDDTYNNDLGGLELSLQFLAHQNQKKKKRLILSDILESGLPDDRLIRQIRSLLEKYHVLSLIGIGPVLTAHQELLPGDSQFYASTEDFLNNFNTDSISEEIVLIKGARKFAFENIVKKLQRRVHGTVMEVDLGALVHNLNYFRFRLKPETKIMVMVKAFAYGSGSPEVANVLQYHRVDYLGVAYVDEGVELRKNNIRLPIMVMNPSEDSFDPLIAYNLEPEIYNFKLLKSLLKYLNGRLCQIHVKLDTGMHRLGFEEQDLTELIQILGQNPNLQVASIFSHLAAADESGQDDFSNAQANKFLQYANQITTVLGYTPLLHILNSSGILRFPTLQFDMVRLGIGLYGVDPTHEDSTDLKPVATLKTVISQIKKIKQGESIGYGRRGVAEIDMTLATIAIGYADGFSRRLSGGVGEVLIAGRRAKIMGNVCMDMTMVDITGIEAKEGDEVIIFGDSSPIQEIATKIQTIPYEILTGISERVKRVFVSDGI